MYTTNEHHPRKIVDKPLLFLDNITVGEFNVLEK